ncbi:WxL domain-containing protein [Enterococcus casseliflavus]|nr:WxL domain-containing protein [Enterococcus casseliflavus]
MKIKNLLICGALLAPTMLGATVANADQQYADATHATTDAIIQFDKDTDPTNPVDPADPTIPVNPVDPTNPNGAELMITYASNLDFGTHKNSETSFSALGDEMTDGTFITPFVSIKDSRGTDRTGWTLTAKIDGDFKDSKDEVLKGAEVTYSNMYSGSGEATAPTVVTSSVTLTDQEQVIAGAGTTNGGGQHSIGLGQLDSATNTTNGVTLTVPNGTAINADQYKTTITYNLTADPFTANP